VAKKEKAKKKDDKNGSWKDLSAEEIKELREFLDCLSYK